MQRNQKKVSGNGALLLFVAFATAIVLENGLVINKDWYWPLLAIVPVLMISLPVFRRK